MPQSWGQKEWKCSNKELLEFRAPVRGGHAVSGGKDLRRGEYGRGHSPAPSHCLAGFQQRANGIPLKIAKTPWIA